MTVNEIIGYLGGGGAALVIIILGLIKVKPLEISVWSWLFRKIGRAFNGETLDRLGALETQLQAHLQAEERERAVTSRQRILRFADEMYTGVYHSRDHFEEILEQIDSYDKFCEAHADFKNGRTVAAAKLIKDQYDECLAKRSFEISKQRTNTTPTF